MSFISTLNAARLIVPLLMCCTSFLESFYWQDIVWLCGWSKLKHMETAVFFH